MITNNKHKDIIGMILLSLSIIILGYMLISPLSQMMFHADEYFTVSTINFPIMQIINITSHDVHPPLHYLLLKVISQILTILGIEFDKIFIYKLMSIIPYAIILIISMTKIKNEYGYLTAGLFSFSLGVMSEFFIHFLTIRMYSWAILFVILAFIYLKGVMNNNDIKSWVLLTIFSVLAAYTHYFAAIPIVCIYLSLFIYLFMNNKQNLKYWIISTISGIILYSPWILSLISQLSFVSEDFWIPELTIERFLGFVGYFVYSGKIYVSLLSIAILIAIIIIYAKQSTNLNEKENFYILCGIIAYFGTILIGTAMSLLLKPILVDRYLLPSAAILWFSISIIINKIEDKKKFFISFALIAILLLAGTAHTISLNDYWYDEGMPKQAFFNQISQDENSMLIITPSNYKMFYLDMCNSTDLYLLKQSHDLFGLSLDEVHETQDFKEINEDKIPKLIGNNKDKNIYIIFKTSHPIKNIKTKTLIEEGSLTFAKVTN